MPGTASCGVVMDNVTLAGEELEMEEEKHTTSSKLLKKAQSSNVMQRPELSCEYLVTAVCNSTPLKLLKKCEGHLAPQVLWQGMLAPFLQSCTSWSCTPVNGA